MSAAAVISLLIAAAPFAHDDPDRDSWLKARTDAEIIQCGSDERVHEIPYCGFFPWELAHELCGRHHELELIKAYRSARLGAKRVVVFALYLSAAPEVLPFMRRIAARSRSDEEVEWARAYLAKHCDVEVLREYSSKPYRIAGPGSSLEYSTLVPYFATCKYRPAIPYLIWLLDAASGNVGAAALDTLNAFFPNTESFRSVEDAQLYFRARLAGRRRH